MQGRRVCFPAVREVTWEDISLNPDHLKPTEMLVETHYTLNSGTEEATLYSGSEWSWDVGYPRYPGYTNIGRVMHAGPEAQGVVIGDLVFSYANHSSLAKIDVKHDFYLKVPEDLDIKYALFARLGSVAMTSPSIATYKPGDWVMVFGLGLVGNLAAQLFQISGTSVIGVDLIDSRLEVARQCGISYTVNHKEEHLTNIVQTLTNGRGVEIVIDAVGNATCVMEGLELLRQGGQVLLLGHMREISDTPSSDLIRMIFLKWATVKSSWELQLPQKESDQVQTSIESNTRDIFRMLQDGRLQVDKLISHVIKPAEIQDAYEGLINRKDNYWGVILDWT